LPSSLPSKLQRLPPPASHAGTSSPLASHQSSVVCLLTGNNLMTQSDANAGGSLVCVGIGMTLGSHLTALARDHIRSADVVFTGLSDGIIELWIARMNPDVRSLQSLYREGKSRMDTYREMVETMLAEVRAGKRVCAAFYGHPGVFAWPTHKAIEIARSEGYSARMEP